ncbi:MAG TPA: TenA family transcriptional regulator [Rubrobacteraceae bacterium]|nr:TenA family transcriptional regulator [Rubrobacteraceae bacterium]
MRVARLIKDYPDEWRAATRHLFLDGVREGSLPKGTFETWLAPDYLFVRDLLVCQSRLLARLPRLAQPAVVSGLAALVDELGWFEEHAGSIELALDAPRHPSTDAYWEFMAGLEEMGYPARIVALWAMERAYLEAWRSAAPGQPDCRPFVEHWTVPEFAGYVAALEAAADAVLGGAASGSEREEAGRAFLGVARLEREFWEMAFSGDEG